MKNTINRFALLLGVITATTLSASAQGPGKEGEGRGGQGGPGARAPREVSEEVLKEFDKDKDGKLNAEERKAAGAARKAKWDAMTEDERKDATAKRRAEMEKRRAEWEALTPAEREKKMAERKAQMEERMMKRFDKDGDGELNETEQAEMDKAIEEMKKRGGRRGGGAGRGGEGRGGEGRGGKKKAEGEDKAEG